MLFMRPRVVQRCRARRLKDVHPATALEVHIVEK